MCNTYLYVYVSLIVLVYLCKSFYTKLVLAIKSLFSIRHFAVATCTPKRTYFYFVAMVYLLKLGSKKSLRNIL